MVSPIEVPLVNLRMTERVRKYLRVKEFEILIVIRGQEPDTQRQMPDFAPLA